ncbi:MAG: hypothetical protein WAM14_18170 [Candidatus Nitrosopolaris sp.]
MIKKELNSFNISLKNKIPNASGLKGFTTPSFIKLMAFALLTATLIVATTIIPLQLVNGQNASASKSTNNTGAAAKTTITTTGNKTILVTNAAPSKGNTPAYNRTGFTNLYVLTINGKTFPIKYSIVGGKLVGMLADKDRTTTALVLNPSGNGGNLTIELPRKVIDSKGASNADTKYLVKIDGKGVDYKEVANNVNARVLSINFSKDNRFMEIIGTQMAS